VRGHEFLHFGGRPVIDGNLITVIGDVESEVLAHDGEADEPDIGDCFWHNLHVLDSVKVEKARPAVKQQCRSFPASGQVATKNDGGH
jgi:nucleoside-specific outer membrane channel protein Tsx